LSPSEVLYTQDSIGCKFTNGDFLPDVFADLLYGRVKESNFPTIEVVKQNYKWSALTGNRRLYLYRKLVDLGVVKKITVVKRSLDDENVQRRFLHRNTTTCEGRTIKCRQEVAETKIAEIIEEWLHSTSDGVLLQGERRGMAPKAITLTTRPAELIMYEISNIS
jgi:hypothetical protein